MLTINVVINSIINSINRLKCSMMDNDIQEEPKKVGCAHYKRRAKFVVSEN